MVNEGSGNEMDVHYRLMYAELMRTLEAATQQEALSKLARMREQASVMRTAMVKLRVKQPWQVLAYIEQRLANGGKRPFPPTGE